MTSQQKPRGTKPNPVPAGSTRQVAKPATEKKQKNAASKSFLQQLNEWFDEHTRLVLYTALALSVVIGIFLFDVKISTGGDDSSYIEMANNFIKGRSFPSWHGPLYPIFLSLPMLLFGVNVVWLKLFSFVFVISHLVLFYFTFRRHISPALFALVLMIIAVNSTILYFASQTYSEAMFMFLQSLIIFLFIQIYSQTADISPSSFKEEALNWLMLGFFVFLASLTRNIGIVALLAMVFFLLIEKKFRAAVMLTVSYVIFLIPFRLYRSIAWGSGQTSGQLSEIMLKNPYNRALGSEDLAGMITRFFENARLYLSKHFMIGLGLHDPASTDKSWFVTFVVIVLFFVALYQAFKKDRIMLFLAVYLGASISAMFLALQQSWDQMRMVVIYIPMLLLLLAWGIQQMAGKKGYGFLHLALFGLLILIFFKTLGQATDKMRENRKVLARNMKGDLYYGFTPDWQNFLKMSEWVGKNIPDTLMVASRKPSMSYIYSKGRDFYGMYRFPVEVPEKLVNEMIQRTGALQVLPESKITDNLPPDMRLALKHAAVAYVAEGGDIYGVYEFNDAQGTDLLQNLQKNNLRTFSADSLLNRVRSSSKTCFAVSPDTLIKTLRRNDVDYVIVANLRANPKVNNGNVINNIQRYLYFIELKYPGIYSLVHQVGRDNEEPAWLYRVNYQLYGL
jgi:hypothetical protein